MNRNGSSNGEILFMPLVQNIVKGWLSSPETCILYKIIMNWLIMDHLWSRQVLCACFVLSTMHGSITNILNLNLNININL